MFVNLQKALLVLATTVFLFGCAGRTAPEQQAETGPGATDDEVRVERQEPKDPCEEAQEKAVRQARSELKTARASCQDMQIEATPRWSFDYDGAVHLVIRNAQGEIIRDELLLPDEQEVNPAGS